MATILRSPKTLSQILSRSKDPKLPRIPSFSPTCLCLDLNATGYSRVGVPNIPVRSHCKDGSLYVWREFFLLVIHCSFSSYPFCFFLSFFSLATSAVREVGLYKTFFFSILHYTRHNVRFVVFFFFKITISSAPIYYRLISCSSTSSVFEE